MEFLREVPPRASEREEIRYVPCQAWGIYLLEGIAAVAPRGLTDGDPEAPLYLFRLLPEEAAQLRLELGDDSLPDPVSRALAALGKKQDRRPVWLRRLQAALEARAQAAPYSWVQEYGAWLELVLHGDPVILHRGPDLDGGECWHRAEWDGTSVPLDPEQVAALVAAARLPALRELRATLYPSQAQATWDHLRAAVASGTATLADVEELATLAEHASDGQHPLLGALRWECAEWVRDSLLGSDQLPCAAAVGLAYSLGEAVGAGLLP